MKFDIDLKFSERFHTTFAHLRKKIIKLYYDAIFMIDKIYFL